MDNCKKPTSVVLFEHGDGWTGSQFNTSSWSCPLTMTQEMKNYSTDRTQPNRKRTQTGPRVRLRGPVGVCYSGPRADPDRTPTGHKANPERTPSGRKANLESEPQFQSKPVKRTPGSALRNRAVNQDY